MATIKHNRYSMTLKAPSVINAPAAISKGATEAPNVCGRMAYHHVLQNDGRAEVEVELLFVSGVTLEV